MSSALAAVDPEALLRRASALLDAGRVGAAGPLLAAVRCMLPDSGELSVVSARLAMAEGRPSDAIAELNAAIAAEPANGALRKLRAEAWLRCDNHHEAAADAAEAVILSRADASANALLGIVLLQLRRFDEAVACLGEATRLEPGNPAFLQGLAAGLEATGDLNGAAAALSEGIAASPGSVALRSAATLLFMRMGDCDAAVECAEAARRAGVADACVFGLKGHALSKLGRQQEASEAYREALKLAPEDPYVRHLVAASGVVAGAPRAPAAYLRAVFDGYASRFEDHLINLRYRVPGLFRAALMRHLGHTEAGSPVGPVLDLGCGTGMVAVACSDLALHQWEGVDLSSHMLNEAAQKGIYAALHESDILDWLDRDERLWPVILGADVLCYFGRLEELFAQIGKRLHKDGIILVSLEERVGGAALDGQGWILQGQGRYAHQQHYLEDVARLAGLRFLKLDRQTLRCDGGEPVSGFIAVLAHAR